MKLAVTSEGNNLQLLMDPRFGWARYFVVVDADTGVFPAFDNAINFNAVTGAGIQAGKRVAKLDVNGGVTGRVGAKAFSTSQAPGVRVYTAASGFLGSLRQGNRLLGARRGCAGDDEQYARCRSITASITFIRSLSESA